MCVVVAIGEQAWPALPLFCLPPRHGACPLRWFIEAGGLRSCFKTEFSIGRIDGAKDCCGQLMKGLKVRSASFVAQLQSPEVAEPTERAFDDVMRVLPRPLS